MKHEEYARTWNGLWDALQVATHNHETARKALVDAKMKVARARKALHDLEKVEGSKVEAEQTGHRRLNVKR